MCLPIQDQYGIWLYKNLPKGSRLVTVDMYYNGVFNKLNTPFVIYSIVFNEYHCYRVNPNTKNIILPFIQLNKVYLIPTNNCLSHSKEDIIPIINNLELDF